MAEQGGTRFDLGYELPDLRPIRTISKNPRLVGGAVVTQHGTLTTQDFVPGTGMDGWYLDGDGSFEFGGGVFRGEIIAESFATDEVPNERVAIDTTDRSRIRFYTGDSDETAFGSLSSDMIPVGGSKAAFLALQPQTVTGDGGIRPLIGAESRRVNGSREAFIYLTINDQDYIQIERALDASSKAIHLQTVLGYIILNAPNSYIDFHAPELRRTTVLWDEQIWHSVSSFLNGWSSFGGAFQAPRYRLVGGMVQVQGHVKSGTINTSAFTLPVGYRPAGTLTFAGVDGANTGQRLDIQADGSVRPVTGTNSFFAVNCAFAPG